MVASMVAQCKCIGKGLVADLRVYHGRLLFALDYQPGNPPPPPFIRLDLVDCSCTIAAFAHHMHK